MRPWSPSCAGRAESWPRWPSRSRSFAASSRGRPRLVAGDDGDLALLAGDYLYALGLERLAALGDLEAVRALGDVISRVAQAHAEGHPERADQAWEAGARVIGGL